MAHPAFFHRGIQPALTSGAKAAAITAAVGIAGVVGVLVGVLAIAEGFRRAMTVSERRCGHRFAERCRQRDDQRADAGHHAAHRGCSGCGAECGRGAEFGGAFRHHQPAEAVDRHRRECAPARRRTACSSTCVVTFRWAALGRRFEPGKNEIMVGTGRPGPFPGWNWATSCAWGKTHGRWSAFFPRTAASRSPKSGRTRQSSSNT